MAVVAAVSTVSLIAQVPLVPPKLRKPLEGAAVQLARAERTVELAELRRVLANAGHDADALRKLDAKLAKAAQRTKRAFRLPKVAKTLRQTARAWAKLLPKLDGERREDLAMEILALDASVALAHDALGHVQIGGTWRDPEEREREKRRAAITDAMARARKLEVPIEVGKSTHPVLREICGRDGLRLRAGKVELHTSLAEIQASRILRQSMRAAALARWFVNGRLEQPAMPLLRVVMLDSREAYQRAVRSGVAAGAIPESDARESARLAVMYDKRGWQLRYNRMETQSEIGMLLALRTSPHLQPCLEAGLLNWVSLSFLGAPLPQIRWRETKESEGQSGGGTAAGRPNVEPAEREEYYKIANAGMAGCRSWLAHLAAHGQDPKWSESFVDVIGKIRGNALLKCTMVVEFLAERGPLEALARATTFTQYKPPKTDLIPLFEAALDDKLTYFEEDWRAWILPRDWCLANRIDRKRSKPTKAQAAVLSTLNRIRRATLTDKTLAPYEDVSVDAELSVGCLAHAVYLRRHPAQQDAWPDAHEEYPDRDGFSVDGSRAGLASVIAPGVATPKEAIDGWMGTFYHRLPLLEPGLARIGWGFAGRCAVLDSGSMVAPRVTDYAIKWPHAGMKNTPTRFSPELPSPVPGEDQSKWGYPITLQIGFADPTGEPQVRMTLHAGNRNGKPVECWFSTPTQPTNPELAPRLAYCLIPKETLKRGAKYTVVAIVEGKGEIVWSFQT